jgi:hypothetical protein
MVEDRLRDGRRIAQLLASEVTGDADRLPGVAVVEADRDVAPTVDGAFAFALAHEPRDGVVPDGIETTAPSDEAGGSSGSSGPDTPSGTGGAGGASGATGSDSPAGAGGPGSASDAGSSGRLAEVFVHPDRARLEVLAGQAAAAAAAEAAGLRVRPKAVTPPRTLVFLPDGASVKRATRVLSAALEAADAAERPDDPAG